MNSMSLPLGTCGKWSLSQQQTLKLSVYDSTICIVILNISLKLQDNEIL